MNKKTQESKGPPKYKKTQKLFKKCTQLPGTQKKHDRTDMPCHHSHPLQLPRPNRARRAAGTAKEWPKPSAVGHATQSTLNRYNLLGVKSMQSQRAIVGLTSVGFKVTQLLKLRSPDQHLREMTTHDGYYNPNATNNTTEDFDDRQQ